MRFDYWVQPFPAYQLFLRAFFGLSRLSSFALCMGFSGRPLTKAQNGPFQDVHPARISWSVIRATLPSIWLPFSIVKTAAL